MHVNLSVKQMNEDGLVQLVADVLAETKLAARKLVLEVTESIFILHYERHVKILNTLRAKGIGVALDDFGCGYSSLNHLRHLPIDWVKIDRSFISALESDAGSREVVSALFGLCQAMHLPVVAEGRGDRRPARDPEGAGLPRHAGIPAWPARAGGGNPGFGLGGVIIWVACKPRPHWLPYVRQYPRYPFHRHEFRRVPRAGHWLRCRRLPPGLELDAADIQRELDRRRPGTSRHVTQRQEADQVEILSGVYEGVTTGTPIGLLIRNTDARSKDYSNIADTFRPGHADYAYWRKFGVRDPAAAGVRRRG